MNFSFFFFLFSFFFSLFPSKGQDYICGFADSFPKEKPIERSFYIPKVLENAKLAYAIPKPNCIKGFRGHIQVYAKFDSTHKVQIIYISSVELSNSDENITYRPFLRRDKKFSKKISKGKKIKYPKKVACLLPYAERFVKELDLVLTDINKPHKHWTLFPIRFKER